MADIDSEIQIKTLPFDASKFKLTHYQAARKWFNTVRGTPYGWGDLANFADPFDVIQSQGQICSQFKALLDKAAKHQWWADDYAAGKITPRDFQVAGQFTTVWSR